MKEQMNKKLVILTAVITLVVLLFFFLILLILKGKNPVPDQTKVTSTPTRLIPTAVQPGVRLSLISTDPQDGEAAVALDNAIVLTFNRSLKQSEVLISFTENFLKAVLHTYRIKGQTLGIIPNQPLVENTVYKIVVTDRVSQLKLGETSFLTVTLTQLPDTRPVELISQIEAKTLIERPDIFLVNKLPYSDSNFEMVMETDQAGEFNYIVTSTKLSGAALETKVKKWLLSLGLTNSQINDFILVYR